MENVSNKKLIRKYGSSQSLLIVFTILGLMFAGVGGFVLSIIPSIGKTIQFSGNVSVLYGVGMGAAVLGLFIIVLTFLIMQAQPKFFLYEDAIKAVGKKYERADLLETIEDVFVFLYGGFGYRATQNDKWIFVGGKISGYADLTTKFIDLHSKKRVEKLLLDLKSQKPVIFRYMSYENAMSKSVVASRNLDFPLKEIKVTPTHIYLENKSIAINYLSDMKSNLWSEKLSLIDRDGNVFFETHPSAILSLSVFYDLLVQLQGNALENQ